MRHSVAFVTFGYILFGYALGNPTTPDPKAGFDSKMKNAVEFLDKIDAAVSKDGVDPEKLLDVLSLLGPEFAAVGTLLKIGLKLLKDQPAQMNDTMTNGFAEVNSRLKRMEEQIQYFGNVVGDENTITELRNRVGAVMSLREEYIQYVKLKQNGHELQDVLTKCRSENGNPKELLKFVKRSLIGGTDLHNILGSTYNKASHNRTMLWKWYKAIILDCVEATTLELICESLEGREENSIKDVGQEMGDDLKKIAEKMVQYDGLLLKEFADDTIRKPLSLFDEINREIQNYKSNGWNQGMADYLNKYLHEKYDFALWTVLVARDNVKAAWVYEHVIYHAKVLDKVHSKLFQMDAYMVLVNWALKSESTRVATNRGNLQTDSWMPQAIRDAKAKGGTCEEALNQLGQTEWFPRNNVSQIYVKHSVKTDGDPYVAGDGLTDCARVAYDCRYWGTHVMSMYYCWGFF